MAAYPYDLTRPARASIRFAQERRIFYNLRRALRRNLARFQRANDRLPITPLGKFDGPCPCCGSLALKQIDILWGDLVDVWGLESHEVTYINRQQGYRCMECGSRLRSMALAAWLLHHMGSKGPLSRYVEESGALQNVPLLEINEAGQLSQFLQKLPGHVLAAYPAVDIQDMQYPSESFGIVVHSDTLEHIADPLRALSECHRVLRPGGVCAFTVPVVVDRLTRSTKGSLASYHGHAYSTAEDLRVHTEFGADTWKIVTNAGFREYRLFAFEYPGALVHIGVK